MNRTYRILPVYAGDVSGACSALYELGGMVVIHDPSGCNSTYNTHDETRWYDRDSLIFITGLTERDAVLGNDEKLIADTADAARELGPRFIALCNSPIPFLNGTDFAAVTKLIERRTGIPCFYVPTNGMHDYVAGAGHALAAWAERFVKTPERRRPRTLNILGATPLDLGIAGSDAPLRAFARRAGFEVISCWAMGDGPDALSRAGEAAVNLVVSAAGLPAAKLLRRRFGTPWVAGFPVMGFRQTLAAALRQAEETGTCAVSCRDARTASADGTFCAVGEPVMMGSAAAAAEAFTGRPVRLLCPLEADGELLGPGDLRIEGEEEAERALKSSRTVIADPMYGAVCPKDATLISLPHQAFSGRNGWKTACDPAAWDLRAALR